MISLSSQLSNTPKPLRTPLTRGGNVLRLRTKHPVRSRVPGTGSFPAELAGRAPGGRPLLCPFPSAQRLSRDIIISPPRCTGPWTNLPVLPFGSQKFSPNLFLQVKPFSTLRPPPPASLPLHFPPASAIGRLPG